MFCPQCRQNWSLSAPLEQSLPRSKWDLRRYLPKKAQSKPRHCPNCQSLLVNDRLEQEFPPVAHASKSDGSLSVTDFLREISAPGVVAGPLPPDKSRAAGASGVPSEEDGRRFPQGWRRSGRGQNSTDSILGFAALGAIVIILSALCLSVVWDEARLSGIRAEKAAIHQSAIGAAAVSSWQPAVVLNALPSTLPGGWRRWETDSVLTHPGQNPSVGERVATYQRGAQFGRVWLLRVPETKGVLAAFAGSARAIHTPQGVLRRLPQQVRLFDRDCFIFDGDTTSNTPHYVVGGAASASAETNTVSWYQQGVIVTVAGADRQIRDDLAAEYAASH